MGAGFAGSAARSRPREGFAVDMLGSQEAWEFVKESPCHFYAVMKFACLG